VRVKEIDCSRISVTYHTSVLDSIKIQNVHIDSAVIFRRLAGMDLSDMANKYIRRLFKYTPSRTTIRLLEAKLAYAGKITRLGVADLKMIGGKVTGTLFFSGEGSQVNLPVEGRFNKSSYLTEIRLVNTSHHMLPVPLLKDKYGVEAGFDSVDIALDFSGHDRHRTDMSGEFNFSGFKLNGERLSSESIAIDSFGSSFLAHLGSHYVELDSISAVYLNKIRMNPYFRLSIKSNPEIEFKILPVTWNAGEFFSSLPEGMFTSLIGLKAEGSLHYDLDFKVDLDRPDSLKFSTSLIPENFRILGYGADDYRMLNSSFYHRVYENGQLKAAFIVGSDNPDFVEFDQISPFLRAAVMTSEDGSFFYHHGFNTDAFRASIITNLRERRFARGGSTLTMQLVKNVFLTRNKTVARKIEEALIVWMIENQNLVSKKRMYEVYLNLIEWGPGIYGINEASRFYFNKGPRDLNLQESIFLASIVPHPKWYRYTFEINGVPKPFFKNYFHMMEELMVRKQFIEAGDTSGVNSFVTLTGIASQAFAAADTVRADSVILKELETIPAVVKLNIGTH
jgi:hypothetical protein